MSLFSCQGKPRTEAGGDSCMAYEVRRWRLTPHSPHCWVLVFVSSWVRLTAAGCSTCAKTPGRACLCNNGVDCCRNVHSKPTIIAFSPIFFTAGVSLKNNYCSQGFYLKHLHPCVGDVCVCVCVMGQRVLCRRSGGSDHPLVMKFVNCSSHTPIPTMAFTHCQSFVQHFTLSLAVSLPTFRLSLLSQLGSAYVRSRRWA